MVSCSFPLKHKTLIAHDATVGVTIGFEEESYTAGESDGTAFVVAVVQNGELSTDVVINFITAPQTATGKMKLLVERGSVSKILLYIS